MADANFSSTVSIFAVITDEYAPRIKKGEYVVFNRTADPIPEWEIIVGTKIEKFDGSQDHIDGVVECWFSPNHGKAMIEKYSRAAIGGAPLQKRRVPVLDMMEVRHG